MLNLFKKKEFISYYENGKINSKSNYVNNVEHGECLLYFENGEVLFKINSTFDK